MTAAGVECTSTKGDCHDELCCAEEHSCLIKYFLQPGGGRVTVDAGNDVDAPRYFHLDGVVGAGVVHRVVLRPEDLHLERRVCRSLSR